MLKALRDLMSKGLIIKKEDMIGGVRVCKYSAIPSSGIVDNVNNSPSNVDNYPNDEAEPGAEIERVVQKLNHGGAKTEPTGSKIEPDKVQKLNRGGSKTEPNNINNNINNTLTNTLTNTTESGGERKPEGANRRDKPSDREAEFEELWALYPPQRRQGKSKAREAYIRARRSGVSMEAVRQGLEAYKQQCAAEQTPLQYIKQGGTWFKSRGWEDTYNSAVSPPQRSPTAKKINWALNYEQRNYSLEELKNMGLSFGEEVYDD